MEFLFFPFQVEEHIYQGTMFLKYSCFYSFIQALQSLNHIKV